MNTLNQTDDSKQGPQRVSMLTPAAKTDSPTPQATVGADATSSTGVDTTAKFIEATQNLWKIYGITNEWIRSSDTKAAAVLSANALLASAAINAFGHINGFNQSFLLRHHVVLTLDLTALAMAVASVACCLFCIVPKLTRKDAPANSLIYFGHVAQQQSARDYETAVHTTLTNPETAMNQISDQVWVNSKIARTKLRSVQWAIGLFGAALLFFLIATAAAKLS